jgi:cysteine desulfurase
MQPKVYLDFAASTPVDTRVLESYLKATNDFWANPSAVHAYGQITRQALERARISLAKSIGCKASQIVFTSTATEANNLGILGLLSNLKNETTSKPHVLYSGLEHSSVWELFQSKNSRDYFEAEEVSTNEFGIIHLPSLVAQIKPETRLISLMLVNNEIGTLQPVIELQKALKEINQTRQAAGLPRIFIHSDAVQALQFLEVDFQQLGIDLLVLSGQKIYAPKGAACLVVGEGISVSPTTIGGGQEKGLRSGTPNVPAIVAFAAAAEICNQQRVEDSQRLTQLRDETIQKLLDNNPSLMVNGYWNDLEFVQGRPWIQSTFKKFQDLRIANNINLIWPGIDQQTLLTFLDMQGICVSSGSSCSSGAILQSQTIKLLNSQDSNSSAIVRITLGRTTTEQDMHTLIQVFAKAQSIFGN